MDFPLDIPTLTAARDFLNATLKNCRNKTRDGRKKDMDADRLADIMEGQAKKKIKLGENPETLWSWKRHDDCLGCDTKKHPVLVNAHIETVDITTANLSEGL
jgi:hypothetical protein